MGQFRAKFAKMVYDDTGHRREICQRMINLEVRDPDAAWQLAVRCFCELEGVASWLDHADWLELAELGPGVGT